MATVPKPAPPSRDRDRASRHGLAAVFALAWLWLTPAFADGQNSATTLRQSVQELAAEHGFTLKGAQAIEDEVAPQAIGDTVAERLRSLLRGYNYVMREGAGGSVVELRILGLRPAPTERPRQVAVPTFRLGAHRLVETLLVGPGGARIRMPLIVDTGASSIVLPTSLIEELGFDEADLRQGWADTAGGRQPSRLGTLAAVTVGGLTRNAVAVAFLDDSLIGAKGLLGMSFLGHFHITLRQSEDVLYLSDR